MTLEEEELWIELNAKWLVEYWGGDATNDWLNDAEIECYTTNVSRNDLKKDKKFGHLRFTLEELQTLNFTELSKLYHKHIYLVKH